jgi:hypothetical protein
MSEPNRHSERAAKKPQQVAFLAAALPNYESAEALCTEEGEQTKPPHVVKGKSYQYSLIQNNSLFQYANLHAGKKMARTTKPPC